MNPLTSTALATMKRLSIFLVLAAFSHLRAQTEPAGSLKLETTGPVMLHENVKIRATGQAAQEILAEWEKSDGCELKLQLDGVELPNLETALWKEGAANQDIVVQFNLMRHPTKETSRQAWDLLLDNTTPIDFVYSVSVALAVGSQPARRVAGELKFGLAKANNIYWTVTLCAIGFIALVMLLGWNSNILRDGGQPDAAFSLGRTQMAFWGLLVFFAWVGVSFTTGAMEHLPVGVLTLIGISTSTGLSALVIANNQEVERQRRTATVAQRNALQKQMGAASYELEQADADLLAQLNGTIAAFPVQQNGAVRPTSQPARFFHDLCSDPNGLSFQRLQVVLWTVALGGFFVWRVIGTLSLPVIPNDLLILMGISNGTYLGFKIPERG